MTKLSKNQRRKVNKVKDVELTLDGIINFKPTSERSGGSSYQGEVVTSYKQLVKLFGEPNCTGDKYKVSTEWILQANKVRL
jgi:hypothetical protein